MNSFTGEAMSRISHGKKAALFVSSLVLCLLLASNAGTFWASPNVSASRQLSDAVQVKGGDLEPLFPLHADDYIGIVLAVAALLVAAGGGIGGGGLLVPIFLLIMNFPVKHAVSLSNVTVFGGAVANAVLNAPKTHPLAKRPLIDWNLLAMMEPLTMVGALIGTDLNEILPDVVVVVLLVLLLGYTAVRTLEKANELYAAETAAFNEEAKPLVKPSTESTNNASYGGAAQQDLLETPPSRELLEQLAKESHTDWSLVAKLAMLFGSVILLSLIKGGSGLLLWIHVQEVRCGSTTFYALEALTILIIVAFVVYIRRKLVAETRYKDSIGYTFIKGDIHWDESNTIYYASLCSTAGLFAGLFGLGGGIVKSPLMLEMGVHPAVASATCATMILFTSVTATTSFIVYGELDYDYGAAFLVVGFLSTLVGQLVMQALMKKYNRNSYIAYSVALVVGASAVAMTWSSILAIASGESHGGGMCSSVNV